MKRMLNTCFDHQGESLSQALPSWELVYERRGLQQRISSGEGLVGLVEGTILDT